MTVHSCPTGGCQLAVLGSAAHGGVWVVGVLQLLVAQDDNFEGVDVVDFGELVTVVFDKVVEERFDGFTPDELEELKAGGVEEVVAGHCVVEDLEDRSEEIVFDYLGIVEVVLEIDALPEEFQRDCGKESTNVFKSVAT